MNRDRVGVGPIADKMRENRLRCFGHVQKRGDLEAVRKAMKINFVGKR